MFFNRTAKPAASHLASPRVAASPRLAPAPKAGGVRDTDDRRSQVARRRAIAVGMAVQFAVPVGGLMTLAGHARGAATMADATRSAAPAANPAARELFGADGPAATLSAAAGPSADAYARGVGQVRAGDYDAAVRTLKAIDVDALPDADAAAVNATLGGARTAVRRQRAARADVVVADGAAAAGRAAAAAGHYRSALDNPFADPETRSRAGDGAARLLATMTAQAAARPALTPPALTPPAPVMRADVVPLSTDAAPAVLAAADPVPAGPVTETGVAPTTVPTIAPNAPIVPATPPGATPPPEAPPAPTPAPVAPAPVAPAPVVPPAPAPQAVVPPAPVAPPEPTPVAQAAPPVAAMPAPADEQAAAQQALRAAADFKRIKLQQQQYQAQTLVAKARGEYAANQKTEAYQDYTRAASLDPANEQAASGRDQTAAELGLGQQGGLERQDRTINERIQAIRYRFNADLQRANEETAAGKFTDAQRALDQARVDRNTDPTLFTTPQLNEFDTQVSNAEVSLKTAQEQASSAEINRSTEDTKRRQDERQREFEQNKQRTVQNLIQDARQYQDQGQYPQALAVIDQIQRVDPTNQYALGVRQLVLDKATSQEQRSYYERRDREFEHQLNAADEQQIPYSDIVHYSDDWPTLSEQRDQEVKADRGEADEDQALQAQLDRHLPELRFNANALSDVIDFLRDVTGANIYVDWPALERASIARDAPVTARLRDIKFSKALELVFKSVEGEDDEHKLGYTIDEGVITISTRKELNKNTVTRRYDINDLLFVAPDYNNAPQLDLQNATQGQSGGGGGGGGGGGNSQSLFQNSNQQQQTNGTGDREARIDEIKQYIQQNVDNNSWKDNGGDVGSVSSSPLRAILLITQTPENQRKIVSVLDSLRASQALQVSIETRFLTVQRNYLEDIGVDADFTFNPLTQPGNARSGFNSSRFSPILLTQNAVSNNTTFVDANGNPVANAAQGSRGLDWASNVANGGVPGSIPSNPADYPNPVTISGSYIDNLTVNFLIRAVEANQNTTALTAPRLTLFSGQRSVLIVETQQAYVSDLTPVVAPGAALFQPQVSTTVATGVVLSVQATVSPDRKYVFLDLQPQLARLQALASFTVSAIVQQNNNNIIGGVNPVQTISGTIQLPTLQVTQVKTSVSVPDGATLLLGGQTLAGENTREQGVPVLSKIPFLKRLFTNRATASDEQILLILVKPTILIQREQEQRQFPQLSSKLTGSSSGS